MPKVSFSYLKKELPKEAEEFVTEQEALVDFLNSPARANWLKMLKLKEEDIKKINEIVEYYAKMKIEQEKRKKPLSREDVIHIEDACLKNIFVGHILKIQGVKERSKALKVAKGLLEQDYKGKVIFDEQMLEKLSVLAGIDGTRRRFPVDFVIFDDKEKKVICVDVVF